MDIDINAIISLMLKIKPFVECINVCIKIITYVWRYSKRVVHNRNLNKQNKHIWLNSRRNSIYILYIRYIDYMNVCVECAYDDYDYSITIETAHFKM